MMRIEKFSELMGKLALSKWKELPANIIPVWYGQLNHFGDEALVRAFEVISDDVEISWPQVGHIKDAAEYFTAKIEKQKSIDARGPEHSVDYSIAHECWDLEHLPLYEERYGYKMDPIAIQAWKELGVCRIDEYSRDTFYAKINEIIKRPRIEK